MNQSEKRRKQLLESARELYRDRSLTPAVHPRYRNTYNAIYGEEKTSGGFGIRLMISCVLFIIFVLMDYQHIEVAEVSSGKVIQMIEKDFEISEVSQMEVFQEL